MPKMIRRRFVPPLPRSLTGKAWKAALTHPLRAETLNNFINLARPSIGVEAGAAGPLTTLSESRRIRCSGHFSDSACGAGLRQPNYMLRGTKPESGRVTDSSLIRSRLVPFVNLGRFPLASSEPLPIFNGKRHLSLHRDGVLTGTSAAHARKQGTISHDEYPDQKRRTARPIGPGCDCRAWADQHGQDASRDRAPRRP